MTLGRRTSFDDEVFCFFFFFFRVGPVSIASCFFPSIRFIVPVSVSSSLIRGTFGKRCKEIVFKKEDEYLLELNSIL